MCVKGEIEREGGRRGKGEGEKDGRRGKGGGVEEEVRAMEMQRING